MPIPDSLQGLPQPASDRSIPDAVQRAGGVEEEVEEEFEEAAAAGDAVVQGLLPSILQVWQQVLHLPAGQLRPDSSFFLSGGDSLQLMQVRGRIRQRLQVDLRLQDAERFSTPLAMAACCAAVLKKSARQPRQEGGQPRPEVQQRQVAQQRQVGQPRPEVQQGQVGQVEALRPLHSSEADPDDYPASANQQGMWLAELLGDGKAMYNLAFALHLDGVLHVELLRQALAALLLRYSALRSTLYFDTRRRQLRAHVNAPSHLVLDCEDVAAPLLQARLQQWAAQAFRLDGETLWRFQLFRLAEHKHVLGLCFHHCVTDGWSIAVLLRSLIEAYNALGLDPHWQVSGIDTAHAGYACAQQQMLANPCSSAWQTLDVWRHRLAGADHSGRMFEAAGQAWPYRLQHIALVLPTDLLCALATSAARLGVTRFAQLLTAFRLSLHRLTGAVDQCIGIPVAGRHSPELEQSVGCYLNLLVSRAGIYTDEAREHTVLRLHRELQQDIDNLQLPFREMLAGLQPQLLPGGHAWFDVLFAFQNLPSAPLAFSGLHHGLARIPLPYGHYVLEVAVSEGARECHLAYADAVLSRADALRLTQNFLAELWRLTLPG